VATPLGRHLLIIAPNLTDFERLKEDSTPEKGGPDIFATGPLIATDVRAAGFVLQQPKCPPAHPISGRGSSRFCRKSIGDSCPIMTRPRESVAKHDSIDLPRAPCYVLFRHPVETGVGAI
jgi:hypothetical protein